MNHILIYSKEGVECIASDQFKRDGLTINVVGDHNLIVLHQPYNFSNSIINIRSSSNSVAIGPSVRPITLNISISNGDHQTVEIGKDFSCGQADFLMKEPYSCLKIGNNCMFSAKIEIMLGDSHQILDTSGVIKNWAKNITLGNNIWVGRSVKIMSGADVPDGCILAYASLINKKFDQPNATIGGIPAKILSTDIQWDRQSLNIKHLKKIEKYAHCLHQQFTYSAEDMLNVFQGENDVKWRDKVINGYLQQKSFLENQLQNLNQQSDLNQKTMLFLLYSMMKLGKYQAILSKIDQLEKSQINANHSFSFLVLCLKILSLIELGEQQQAKHHIDLLLKTDIDIDIEHLYLTFHIAEKLPEFMSTGFFLQPKIQSCLHQLNFEQLTYFYNILSHLQLHYSETDILMLKVGDLILRKKLSLEFFVTYSALLIQYQKFDQAIDLANKFIKKHFNSKWLHKTIILLHLHKKDYEGAEVAYQSALFHLGNDENLINFYHARKY